VGGTGGGSEGERNGKKEIYFMKRGARKKAGKVQEFPGKGGRDFYSLAVLLFYVESGGVWRRMFGGG